MNDYSLSAEARLDLLEIWDFIAADSVDAADRVAADMEKAMDRLAEMPGIGHWREELRNESLRVWPVYSYLIIYRADVVPIEIVRVLSGYRDIGALFGP